LLGADLLADLASENHRTRIGAVGELANLMQQPRLRLAVIAVLEERLPRERDFEARSLIETALKRAAAEAGRGAEGAAGLPTTGPGAGEPVGRMEGRLSNADAEQGLLVARSKAAPEASPPAASEPASAAAPLLKKPVKADPPPVKPRPGWLIPVVLGVAGVAAALVWVPGMVPKRTEPVVVAPPAATAAKSAPAVPAPSPAPLPTFTDTLKDGSAGPTMVRIPAGTFQMGSPNSEPERSSDEQQHSVPIKPFAIGKYEVSFAEYDRFAKKTGRTPPDDGDRPVINVSWDDANAYAAWLAEQTGRPYRLPTEAEWEYAARAGTETPFWTGACIHTDQANYDGNYDYNGCGAKTGVDRKQTLPVDSLAANPWGLHQVAGNVWEWTCSAYADPYDGKETVCISKNDANNWPTRVIRGGAWDNQPSRLRSANRDWNGPSGRNVLLGFRLAQDL
jgi:formylglycine-generating enzyme required for sulfatase activity